jgi:hypothetical protein
MRTLVGCIGLALICALPCLAQDNLLTNPRFEGELDAEDFGWSVRRGGGPDAMSVAIDHEVTYDGAASIRFDQQKPVYSSIGHTFTPKPRTIYAATVHVRATDFVTTGRGVRLFIGDENGRTVLSDRLWADEVEDGWKRLVCVFNSRERPSMSVSPMLNNVCGTVWFSRPTLREVTRQEAAELLGRAHGWSYVEPPRGTGVAYSGRETAHIHPGFPVIAWLSNRNAFDDPGEARMRMVVELPEGVRLAGTYYRWSVVDEQAAEDGTRYEIAGTSTVCPVYLETDWQPGETGTARAWLTWDGGRQQEPHEFELRSIDLPTPDRPERLVCGISGPRASFYPGDMIDYMSRLGFNAVNLWQSSAWQSAPQPEFEDEVRRWHAAGFLASNNYSPLNYPWYDEMLREEEAAQACAIDGTRRPGIPCPSYRGNAWQQEGRSIANLAAHGLRWAHLDEEVWNGHAICFCERCLGRWEGYRAEHHADLAPLSPTEFEADPDDYPRHHAAWTRFKCAMVTEMFAGWRSTFRARAAENGIDPSETWFDSWLSVSPKLNRMYFNLHDPRTLREGLDHQIPMLYEPAANVRAHLAELVATAGSENLITGLTLGEPGNGRGLFTPEQTRAQVLEAAFAPTRGYIFWTYPRSDAGTLAEVARTNHLLAQIEDVLLDGESTDAVSGADLTAYRHEDTIVALVRDGAARLRMEAEGDWTMRDPADDTLLAEVTGPCEVWLQAEDRTWPLVVEMRRK